MNQKINKGQKQTKALIILLVIAVGVIAIGIIGNYVSIAKSPSVVLPGFKAKGDPIWRNIIIVGCILAGIAGILLMKLKSHVLFDTTTEVESRAEMARSGILLVDKDSEIVKCSPELIDSAEITTVSDSKNMDLF